DPYEEAAQQLFEQPPHSPEYVPRDHVPVFVPEFEHPEDLVPAEDEAPASLLPPGFLSPPVRAEIEVLRSERLAYEQEVLETHARHLEWQRQATDDIAVQHIVPTQALEARARDDTLEDTGSSS
nr:hypothetical protein [Tanacetum cinerariifolium]